MVVYLHKLTNRTTVDSQQEIYIWAQNELNIEDVKNGSR